MSTTITTASGITEENAAFGGFTEEERDAVSAYIEEIAGIPDTFDLLEDPDWDVAAGIREETTAGDVFRLFASHKLAVEKWIEGAVRLRLSVSGKSASDDFTGYADVQLGAALRALRTLQRHALDEITGTRKD